MRWLDGVFAVLFLFAAAVQGNDPDPLVWIAAYLIAAGLSLAACLGRIPVLPNGLAAVCFALWFLSLAATLPGAPADAFTSFHMRAASHEEPREAIGLALCAAWTASLAIRGSRRARRRASADGGSVDAQVGRTRTS